MASVPGMRVTLPVALKLEMVLHLFCGVFFFFKETHPSALCTSQILLCPPHQWALVRGSLGMNKNRRLSGPLSDKRTMRTFHQMGTGEGQVW